MRNELLLKLDGLFCATLDRQEALDRIIEAQREIIQYNDGTDMHEVEEALDVLVGTVRKLAAFERTPAMRLHSLLYRIIS